MDAGLLDVLHHAAEVQLEAVVQGVDVDLDRVVEEPVGEHRMAGADLGGFRYVRAQRGIVIDDLHAAPAQHVRGPDQHRVADLAGDAGRLRLRGRRPVPRRGQPGVVQDLGERGAVLGQVDGLGRGAHHRDAGGAERPGQAQRGLPAELDDHALDGSGFLFRVDYLEHVFQGERLEVQPTRGVVVGRDRLRVAVDHDGFVAGLGQREGRVHARVVELDALADAVRPAAQDDHLGFLAPGHLGFVVVGGVQVRGTGSELRRARVHRVVHRAHAEPPADLPDHRFGSAAQLGELRVGEAVLLGGAEGLRVEGLRLSYVLGDLVYVLDLLDEPGVDAGCRRDLFRAGADPQRLVDGVQAAVVRGSAVTQQAVRVG